VSKLPVASRRHVIGHRGEGGTGQHDAQVTHAEGGNGQQRQEENRGRLAKAERDH
jgi:hypothetical protein